MVHTFIDRPSGPFLHDPLFWLALVAVPVISSLLAVLPGIELVPKWPAPLLYAPSVLLYPPLEEIVFRAGLQAWLLRHWPPNNGLWLTRANAVTAIVFALAHLWTHPPLWAIATALPALCLVPSLSVIGKGSERRLCCTALVTPLILHCWVELVRAQRHEPASEGFFGGLHYVSNTK